LTHLKRLGLAVAATALLAGPAQAAIELQWWHAMGGALGERTAKIAEDFNKTQTEYKVVPVYKGNYTETMTGAIAAFRARQQPHIVQVFEVGTATMMAAEGAVYPVHQLMADAGEPFDPKTYLSAVVGYYTTPDGKMLSMPFNSSTPVLYYNKDMFRAAGLDPEKPPRTWPEMAEASQKLIASGGAKCGFITAWQEWIQLENFSAWHNVPIGTMENGFAGLGTELKLNSPLHVKHIQTLAEWQKPNVFLYAGRRGDGDPKFIGGECAMMMQSSAAQAAVKRGAKFEYGVAMLPYWPDVQGAPQNSIIGGATLWVLKGHQAADYKGVARFFSYLSKAEVQAEWHQATGYLPITNAAYELTRSQGFYAQDPGAEVAIKQMTLNPPTANSKGLRFGSYVQIRDILNEELEAIWAGKKTAQQGLDEAVKRADDLLRKFEAAN